MERIMKQGINGYSSCSTTVQKSTLYSLFDDNEIETAKILLQLPDLISESESRNRFSFNWGVKRKRSAISLTTSPSPSPPRPKPPPPPVLTPPIVNGTCGGGDAKQLTGKPPETTSPATPLSFSPSESEEKSKRSSRKSSKKRRKREEWLEMIAVLTQRNESLNGEVENARLKYNKLKAMNLELKARRKELSCGEKVETCLERNKSLILNRMGFFQPIVLKSAVKTEDMEIPENQRNQPLITNQTVRNTESEARLTRMWSSSSNGDVGRVKVNNNRGPLCIIPDLNESIEDGFAGMDSLHHQQFDSKAAIAAEKRLYRMQYIAANKPRNGHNR